MYKIYFYKTRKGDIPVKDYLQSLLAKNTKDSRIKAKKIITYIDMLQMGGTRIGEPFVKHIDGKIWEIRPLRDRILFAVLLNDGFLLLHVFMKRTEKTPEKEIEKAKKELQEFLNGGDFDEQPEE